MGFVRRHPLAVPEGNMDKLAPLINTAFQHEAMKVRISPQELAAGLIRQNHSSPDRPSSVIRLMRKRP
jgi:hypothetical protein